MSHAPSTDGVIPQLTAVIMAGGSGTRFWPLSRRRWPKQFLALGPGGTAAGAPSLLEATFARTRRFCPASRTLIVTSAEHADEVRRRLPQLSAEAVVGEPVGRNTAACVGVAAVVAARQDPSAVLAVFPADHHIGREDAFEAAIRLGAAHAREGRLVTLGLQPSRPETGYGYIEVGETLASPDAAAGVQACRAVRFVEKPDLERARTFLAGGKHLWNSGMFLFRADVILGEIRRHLPPLGTALDAIAAALLRGEALGEVLGRVYPGLASVSIDHGVMEKAGDLVVVRCDLGWSDVGSWDAFADLQQADADGNVVLGEAVLHDCRDTLVVAPHGVAAVSGLRGMVVVATGDAVLVCPKDRAQDVKQLVEALARRDKDEVL